MNLKFLQTLPLLLLLLYGGACPRPAARASAPEIEPVHFDRAIFDTNTQNSGAILQDKDGFLWIGTISAGLFRYDGYELQAYKPGGPNSLSSPYVQALYEDRDGMIWIGTGGGGLDRYDKETDTFKHYKHDPQNPQSISSDTVASFHLQTIREDRAGKLWIGTQNGLNVLDKATGTFKHYFHDSNDPNSLSHDNISALLFDQQGLLWIGTKGGGLNRLDPQTGMVTRYGPDPANPQGLGGEWVTALVQDEAGTLWVATMDNGLYKLDRATGTFTSYLHDPQNSNSLRGNKIASIYRDLSGVLWIAYENGDQLGLSVFDPRMNTFTHYTQDPEATSSLSSTSISSVYQDRAGIVWIVNDSGLVDKLDRRKSKFTLYRHDPKNPNSLNSDVVVPVVEDRRGKIWIGTNVGLQMYDKQTGIFTEYQKTYYAGIYEDQAGTFWLAGGMPAALHIFDRDTGKIIKSFTHDPQNPKSLVDSRQIFDIMGDNHEPDILWIATADAGLEKFQKSTETFTHYQHDPHNPNSLSNNNLPTLYQDEQGILWIPTMGSGLERFDPRTETFMHLRHDPQNPTSLSSDTVNVVFEDAAGLLWVGTAVGFDSFDRKTQTFKHYTSDTGYPVSMIASINQDAEGNLWMGSMGGDGLIKFDPKTEAMRVYKESDGLQGNVFYPLNGILDRDGMMWFGGSKGLNAFYPQDIQDNDYIPPVVITALKQGGEPLPLDKAPERVREITLDWQHDFFEFEYAALNFTRAEKNQYKYMLEGLDQDWFNAGARRFGRYSGLRGGDYTLHIIGSNNDGVWNEKGVSIKVKVIPPWWETGWFYALVITSVLGIGLLIYRSKSNQIKAIQAAALALQKSERNYREVFNATSDALFIHDETSRVLDVNDRMCAMFGYDRETARGLAAGDVSLGTSPYSQAEAEDRVRQAIQEGPQVFEWRSRRHNGELFWSEVALHAGEIAGEKRVIASVRDITERKRAEAEIMRRNRDLLLLNRIIAASATETSIEAILEIICRELALAFDVPQAAVALLDEPKTAATVAAEYLAHGRPSALGHTIPVVGNPSAEYVLTHKVPLVVDDIQSDPRMIAVRDLMRRRGTVSMLIVPLIVSGEVIGTLGLDAVETRHFSTEEVSLAQSVADQVSSVLMRLRLDEERQRLEAQYHQAQKMEAIGRLTGGVAHDFNNLLTVINGYTELLLQSHLDNNSEQQHKDLEQIHRAGQRAADLTRQLLAFSRQQVLQPEVLNLNDVIINIEKMLPRLIGEDIDLLTKLAPQLGLIKADKGQMEQIIMNLAVNARDAMPEGGKLTLETANVYLDEVYTRQHGGVAPGPYIMLAISDTGIGMDAQTQAHIFEPFFTTKERGKGTGLGLAMVYGIISQSGGHIWVYSEIGQGTIFKIYLPQLTTAGEAAKPKQILTKVAGGSETILLVEDDEMVRMLACQTLLDGGYMVLETGNGEQARQVCGGHQGPIHLMLTDVVMPGGVNGPQLAKELTSLYPQLKVLFMSGYTDNAIVHHGVLDPGIAFLPKPFMPADLLRKVREVLDTATAPLI